MNLFTQIILYWLAFDLVIYLIMWYDRKEHHYTSITETINDIKESFTQDE